MARFREERIKIEQDGGQATAALTGDFDMAATFTVEPALERVLDEPELDALTVDLSKLKFIDSTGIGVLFRVDSEARERGVDLRIVPGPREVQRVFEIAGLTESLPFESEPDPEPT